MATASVQTSSNRWVMLSPADPAGQRAGLREDGSLGLTDTPDAVYERPSGAVPVGLCPGFAPAPPNILVACLETVRGVRRAWARFTHHSQERTAFFRLEPGPQGRCDRQGSVAGRWSARPHGWIADTWHGDRWVEFAPQGADASTSCDRVFVSLREPVVLKLRAAPPPETLVAWLFLPHEVVAWTDQDRLWWPYRPGRWQAPKHLGAGRLLSGCFMGAPPPQDFSVLDGGHVGVSRGDGPRRTVWGREADTWHALVTLQGCHGGFDTDAALTTDGDGQVWDLAPYLGALPGWPASRADLDIMEMPFERHWHVDV